eukprot:gene17332-17156_t
MATELRFMSNTSTGANVRISIASLCRLATGPLRLAGLIGARIGLSAEIPLAALYGLAVLLLQVFDFGDWTTGASILMVTQTLGYLVAWLLHERARSEEIEMLEDLEGADFVAQDYGFAGRGLDPARLPLIAGIVALAAILFGVTPLWHVLQEDESGGWLLTGSLGTHVLTNFPVIGVVFEYAFSALNIQTRLPERVSDLGLPNILAVATLHLALFGLLIPALDDILDRRARAIRRLQLHPYASFEALAAHARTANRPFRSLAVMALADCPCRSGDLEREVEFLLQDSEPGVRRAAIRVAGGFCPDIAPRILALARSAEVSPEDREAALLAAAFATANGFIQPTMLDNAARQAIA